MIRSLWAILIFLPTISFANVDLLDISHGNDYGCAVSQDKKLFCWGNNDDVLSKTPALSNVTHVSATMRHACALADGKVACWGNNKYGQTEVPSELEQIVSIKTGPSYSCAATATKVTCWGNAGSLPQTMLNTKFTNISKINSAFSSFCVIDSGKVFCFSQDKGIAAVPANLGQASDVKVVSSYACAMVDSKWSCWGNEASYKKLFTYSDSEDLLDFESNAGNGGLSCTAANGYAGCDWVKSPRDLIGVKKVAVAFGHKSVCVSTAEGVRCWGDMYNTPLKYPISSEIQKIAQSLNENEMDSFLGCYSRGTKVEKKTYTNNGNTYEQVALTSTDDDYRIIAESLTDDVVKAIAGKELLITSGSAAATSTNIANRIRFYKRLDGTWVISSSYGWTWNLTKEECK